MNAQVHSFHIPVMGIGYTIDTPLKVAALGIDSVISLVDDILLEKIRKSICEKYSLPFQEISEMVDDFRAKRITSYLNLMKALVEEKFTNLKAMAEEKGEEFKKYIDLLPDSAEMKKEFESISEKYFDTEKLKSWVAEKLHMGNIDVNIMTKVDKDNFRGTEKLPVEYNDAHAALRGFANSDLHSSVILSAGMNPRLYAYMEKFDDFFPDEHDFLKKKIIIKVSDYRSALIQGKFLAKKGLWVSEFRIESGLNCGGHAFATDGYLLGPVLEEFKNRRTELIEQIHSVYTDYLSKNERHVPANPLRVRFTAQGGVGTAEEHQFLIDQYQLDSVGWGSPFLLVPEVTSIDESTMNQLIKAKEEDLYLSNISPLGVPFNNLRSNTKDLEKEMFIEKGRPGSSCPKKYVALNNEMGKQMCTASRQYQRAKIEQLKYKQISREEYQQEFQSITDKSCICVGLGTSALLVNNIDTRTEGEGVSVCPGPNMAYFSKSATLKKMVDFIYGKNEYYRNDDRPNVFVKELNLYVDYLKNKFHEATEPLEGKELKYLNDFGNNLLDGIAYYIDLFDNANHYFKDIKDKSVEELKKAGDKIRNMLIPVESI